MKFPSLVLVLLSLICCFCMICVVHGEVETTKELQLGAANSVRLGGAECGKEKENVDCKQGKGGAAEETVLDEDYIYTNSHP